MHLGLAYCGAWPNRVKAAQPTRPFGLRTEQGRGGSAVAATLDQPILAGRRRATGEGVAHGHAKAEGNSHRGVG
jgi:hypothetical protein